MSSRMLALSCFVHLVLFGTIVITVSTDGQIPHKDGHLRDTRSAGKRVEKTILKPILTPSKQVLRTITNQFKQVVNKLPNLFGRSSISHRPHSGWKGSKLVPRDQNVLEVVDDAVGLRDDVWRRDEIKRPGLEQEQDAASNKVEQSVVEVFNDGSTNDGYVSDRKDISTGGDKNFAANSKPNPLNNSGVNEFRNSVNKKETNSNLNVKEINKNFSNIGINKKNSRMGNGRLLNNEHLKINRINNNENANKVNSYLMANKINNDYLTSTDVNNEYLKNNSINNNVNGIKINSHLKTNKISNNHLLNNNINNEYLRSSKINNNVNANKVNNYLKTNKINDDHLSSNNINNGYLKNNRINNVNTNRINNYLKTNKINQGHLASNNVNNDIVNNNVNNHFNKSMSNNYLANNKVTNNNYLDHDGNDEGDKSGVNDERSESNVDTNRLNNNGKPDDDLIKSNDLDDLNDISTGGTLLNGGTTYKGNQRENSETLNATSDNNDGTQHKELTPGPTSTESKAHGNSYPDANEVQTSSNHDNDENKVLGDEQFNLLKQTIHEVLAQERDSAHYNAKQIDQLKQTLIKELIVASKDKDAKHSAPSSTVTRWRPWLSWSACSKTCGDGVRMRRRTCHAAVSNERITCPGSSLETRRCFQRHCPVHGGYTSWTLWSSCSESCGQDSLQMRMRICMNPRPQYGGKDCTGSRFRIRYCTMSPCQGEVASEVNRSSTEEKLLDTANVSAEDNDELLESLKDVLQAKTAKLEETLSTEPVDSASHLFDMIYEGDQAENSTTPGDTDTSIATGTGTANGAGTGTGSSGGSRASGGTSTNGGTGTSGDAGTSGDVGTSGGTGTSGSTGTSGHPGTSGGTAISGGTGTSGGTNAGAGTSVGTGTANEAGTSAGANVGTSTGVVNFLSKENQEIPPTSEKAKLKLTNDSSNGKKKISKDINVNVEVTDDLSRVESLVEKLKGVGVKVTEEKAAEVKGNSPFLEKSLGNGRLATFGNVNEQYFNNPGQLDNSTEENVELVVPSPSPSPVSKPSPPPPPPPLPPPLPPPSHSNFAHRKNSSSVFATKHHDSSRKEKTVPNEVQPSSPEIKEQNAILNTLVQVGDALKSHPEESLPEIRDIVAMSSHGSSSRASAKTEIAKDTGAKPKIMGIIRYEEPESEKPKIEKVNLPTKKSSTSPMKPDALTKKQLKFVPNRNWSPWSACTKTCGHGYTSRRKPVCLQSRSTIKYDCSHWLIQKKHCAFKLCHQNLIFGKTSHEHSQPALSNKHVPKVSDTLRVSGKTADENQPSSNEHTSKVTDALASGKTADENQPSSNDHTSKVTDTLASGKTADENQPSSNGHSSKDTLVSGKTADEDQPSSNDHTPKGPPARKKSVFISGRIPEEEMDSASPSAKHNNEVVGKIRPDLDADFLPWSPWGQCSVTCGGGGVRSRKRRCRSSHSPNCIGQRKKIEKCSLHHCPVNGDWSFWSDWTPCSQTCGKSFKVRMRKCNNPPPQYNGQKCSGHEEEQLKCKVAPCAVNGDWSLWSAWGECSHTCGAGYKVRSRTCANPPPSHGGLTCKGQSKEKLGCYLPTCPVDGGFSNWRSWSKCQKSCGSNSFRTRFRFCNNPAPSDDGKTCRGDRLQVSKCPSKPCAVDGGFSPWTSWSACSHSCGDTAVTSRERFCTSPPPSGGGNNCTGQTFQIKLCKSKSCHNAIKQVKVTDDDQEDDSLVKTITEEKEELLSERKIGSKVDLTGLKKKLIENLEKLAPDLSVSVEKNNTRKISDETSSGSANQDAIAKGEKAVESKIKESINKEDSPKKEIKEGDVSQSDLEDETDEESPRQDDEATESNPIKPCGFNPCRIAKCLSQPFADCVPNKDCDPVYYDNDGSVKQDCSVETTFLTIPSSQVCEEDPCKTSMCMALPAAECLTNALCHPVYFDETGNVLNCTGVLKTPVKVTCGSDPCIGKSCPGDPGAKCFTDFRCKSTFWSLDTKEEVIQCREPEEDDEENGQENAADRSQTPTIKSLAHKKSFERPWLRLSKVSLEKLLKESKGNGIYLPHARFRLFTGKKKLNHHLNRLKIHNQDSDEDDNETEDDDDDNETDTDDNQTDDNEHNTGTYETMHSPNIAKLQASNNPRKNPILTLTSMNADQYQAQGGNGVGVTKDWKLKLKPPSNLDSYVESPQVYKVNTLKHDGDQSAGDYLHNRPNHRVPQAETSESLSSESISSEGLSSQGVSSVGLSSEGVPSEGVPSEGVTSEGVTSEGVPSESASSEGVSSEGVSSEGVSSEGVSSDGVSSEGLSPESLSSERIGNVHSGNMKFIPGRSSYDGVEKLLKSDESHDGNLGTEESPDSLLAQESYDNVMKQDLTDVQDALHHADPGIGVLPDMTPSGSRGGALSSRGLEPPSPGLSVTGETRGNIPNDLANADNDNEGGHYVPLDSVINGLRADILKRPKEPRVGTIEDTLGLR